jgi:poly(A) polymerase
MKRAKWPGDAFAGMAEMVSGAIEMTTESPSSLKSLLQEPMIRKVHALAAQAGGHAYLVGGAVRDWLLNGKFPKDLDFTLIDCKADTLAKRLADEGTDAGPGHLVPLDWDFGIHRVVFDAQENAEALTVDLSDALENNLETDLARRDLTINAMALDLQSGELIDPFAGQADLRDKRIRMVSEANLLDDSLRMLRVFRFAAAIQAAEIDSATLETIRRHGPDIWNSAAERIQYELFRFLSVKRCFPYLQVMADCGLLEVIVPDLSTLRTIPASGFHHLGLFEHTLELVRQSETLIAECPPETQDWLRQPFTPSVTRFGLVKLACLLHDIGKPATLGRKQDPVHGERLTFYGHEEVGEAMSDEWLRRMKAGNEVRAYLKKLVRWHLYPCQFGPDSPRKSVLRFYRRMGAETPDVVLLALSDRHSATGPWLDPADLEKSHADHLWLLENYRREQSVLTVPRLLNGRDIMDTLKVGPGPHLKEILDALYEAQQLGEVHSVEEAKAWVLLRYGPPS